MEDDDLKKIRDEVRRNLAGKGLAGFVDLLAIAILLSEKFGGGRTVDEYKAIVKTEADALGVNYAP